MIAGGGAVARVDSMATRTLNRRPVRTAAAAVLLIALIGGIGWLLGPDREAQVAEPPPTALCGAVEHPRLQGGLHLLGDAQPPEEYSSSPPTSGWHTAGVPQIEVRTAGRPLSEPEQVSILEAGGVVVTYGGAADGMRALINEVTERYADRVAVTPYEDLAEGEVAFTSWGVLQRCTGPDPAALETFVSVYGSEPVATDHS